MRNLKKLLSLALVFALVCSLGLGAMAKSIDDFSDAEAAKANAKTYGDFEDEMLEAVQVMIDLGVIKGTSTTNASLNLAGKLTRADFFTLLYRFSNGGNDPSNAWKSMTTDYSDINSSHWAYGAFAWSKTRGYSSYTNATAKTSSPSASMNYYDALLLVLRVLGMKSDNEGITGQNYQQMALAIADERAVNLVRDFSPNNVKEITRGEAFLLFYRLIDTKYFKYADGERDGFTADTLGQREFNIKTVTGVFGNNAWLAASESSVKDKGEILGDYATTTSVLTLTKDATAKYVTNDMIGRKAEIKYKDNNGGDVSTIYSISYKDKAEVSYKGFSSTTSVISHINKLTDKSDAAVAGFIYHNGTATTSSLEAAKGDYTRIIYDGDTRAIKAVYIENYTYTTVKTAAADKITLNKVATSATEYKNFYENAATGLVKDAKVLAAKLAGGGYVIHPLETITGTLTKTSADQQTGTISGKNYPLTTIVDAATSFASELYGNAREYTLWQGYVVYCASDSFTASSDYAVVTDTYYSAANSFGNSTEVAKVKLLLQTGETVSYDLAGIYNHGGIVAKALSSGGSDKVQYAGPGAGYSANPIDSVYAYTVNSDGTSVNLYEVEHASKSNVGTVSTRTSAEKQLPATMTSVTALENKFILNTTPIFSKVGNDWSVTVGALPAKIDNGTYASVTAMFALADISGKLVDVASASDVGVAVGVIAFVDTGAAGSYLFKADVDAPYGYALTDSYTELVGSNYFSRATFLMKDGTVQVLSSGAKGNPSAARTALQVSAGDVVMLNLEGGAITASTSTSVNDLSDNVAYDAGSKTNVAYMNILIPGSIIQIYGYDSSDVKIQSTLTSITTDTKFVGVYSDATGKTLSNSDVTALIAANDELEVVIVANQANTEIETIYVIVPEDEED